MKRLEDSIKGIRDFMDEDTYQFYKGVIQEYCTEYAKEALMLASENVKLGISEYRTIKDGSIGWVVTENENLFIINDGCNICSTKESILSEANLPKHR